MLTITDPEASAAEFAVGKYPNIAPTFANLQWTSYQNKVQNFTISAYDPSFDGGYNCGPNKNEICELYVGILGYCSPTIANSNNTRLDYELTVTTTPAVNNYGVKYTNQHMSAGNTKHAYPFCIPTETNTYVTLDAVRSSCDCTSANDYQMYISKSNPAVPRHGHVLRLDSSPAVNNIPLLTTAPVFKTGTCKCVICVYYMYMLYVLYAFYVVYRYVFCIY